MIRVIVSTILQPSFTAAADPAPLSLSFLLRSEYTFVGLGWISTDTTTFQDLNYRISTKSPKALGLPIIAHKIANDVSGLLLHDQLHQAQQTNSTLHHLQEGPITFKPTYKYKPGTISEFKKFTKRVPGWCDRVLWATWADGEDGAGQIVKRGKDGEEKISKRKGPKTELYRSVMSWTGSDHKPVRHPYFSLIIPR